MDTADNEKLSKSKTTLYLKHRQLDQLKSLTRETGVPMAYVVRDGIDMAIDKWRKRMK